MTTKIDRMMTYFDGLLAKEAHDHLITWSFEIAGQTKIIISLTRQCLWPSNLVGL